MHHSDSWPGPVASFINALNGVQISGKPRQKSAINCWAKTRSTLINALVQQRCLANKQSKKGSVDVWNTVAREQFAKLSEEDKQKWEQQAKDDHVKDVEEWKAVRDGAISTTPQDCQMRLQGIPRLGQELLEKLAEATGWKWTLIGGGPEPDSDGRLSVMSIHGGTTRSEPLLTFGQKERELYVSQILPVFSNFLRDCYTPEDCANRALAIPNAAKMPLNRVYLESKGISFDTVSLPEYAPTAPETSLHEHIADTDSRAGERRLSPGPHTSPIATPVGVDRAENYGDVVPTHHLTPSITPIPTPAASLVLPPSLMQPAISAPYPPDLHNIATSLVGTSDPLSDPSRSVDVLVKPADVPGENYNDVLSTLRLFKLMEAPAHYEVDPHSDTGRSTMGEGMVISNTIAISEPDENDAIPPSISAVGEDTDEEDATTYEGIQFIPPTPAPPLTVNPPPSFVRRDTLPPPVFELGDTPTTFGRGTEVDQATKSVDMQPFVTTPNPSVDASSSPSHSNSMSVLTFDEPSAPPDVDQLTIELEAEVPISTEISLAQPDEYDADASFFSSYAATTFALNNGFATRATIPPSHPPPTLRRSDRKRQALPSPRGATSKRSRT